MTSPISPRSSESAPTTAGARGWFNALLLAIIVASSIWTLSVDARDPQSPAGSSVSLQARANPDPAAPARPDTPTTVPETPTTPPRDADEETVAPPTTPTTSLTSLTLDEPVARQPESVLFLPPDPDGGLLPSNLPLRWKKVYADATVGLKLETGRSLREMELDYREPSWPRSVDPLLQSAVVDDGIEENPALPESTISFTYRLAPYVIDRADSLQSNTPLTWELLTLDRQREIPARDHLDDVDRTVAASLAAVGHREEAERLAVRAYVHGARRRGVDDPLTQRSVLLLVRIYRDWVRGREELFYRDRLEE
ncbi:MAG: hypothetical protein KDC38_12445 [Planctomycetes bacterium]|nr:hypothetical protein [Planctomycetota bacterium]